MAAVPPPSTDGAHNEYHRDGFIKSNKICRFFLSSGTCMFGDQCRFSHDPLTATPPEVCLFFRQGKCSRGQECNFLHVTPEDEEKEKAGNSKIKNSRPLLPPNEAASWVGAAEFKPGQKYTPRFLDDSYSGALKSGLKQQEIEEGKEDYDFCPLHLTGQCLNGDSCPFLHGIQCDICGLYVMHPTDKKHQEKHKKECYETFEEDLKESFKIAETNSQVCGICFEKITEKANPRERRFGILENCMHVFCLECIRKWRSADNFEKKVVKGCPECRVASSFVTPSEMWIDDPEEKKKMIAKYKESLSQKPCKYFNQGKGKCPFGRYCFYLHAYPDGTKQDKSKLSPKKSVVNKNGDISDLTMHLSEFFEHGDFPTYAMLSGILSDDDDDDLLDMLLWSSPTFDSDEFEWGFDSSSFSTSDAEEF